MRFASVVVNNFQALESATVEFSPGLNVVFGPNDFGKSTLATAIRAALLVPPSSSEASRYRPWFVDAVPEVTLTFWDDDERCWKVRKRFGTAGALSTADLYHSKDGSTFSLECQAREVEEQLRKILAWGIPAPGGKGAPRGLPNSFLSHVLLAEQTDVETIFGQSLEDDGTVSGKDRLRKALAALAEDPRFKSILGDVQRKVTEYFTPSGQRKRGRESPFAIVAEAVQRRTERVEALRKGVLQSASTEELIARLRNGYESAYEAHQEAAGALDDVRQRQVRAQQRARAEQELVAATAAVTALERQDQEVVEHERSVTELEAQVASAEGEAAEARQALEAGEVVVREAEEGLRSANSEEGARERELARAKLGAERAELAVQTAQAEKRREALDAARAAADTAKAAVAAEADAHAAAERVLATEATAKANFANAEQELSDGRALLAYGHWHAANEARKLAEQVSAQTEALRATGIAKGLAAQECESQCAQKRAEVKALRGNLPDAVLIARLEELSQELASAEAADGGGISIAVRGSGKIPVHVTLDGREAIAGTEIDGRVVLDAKSTAVLRAGDLLDIEIVAGTADQRRARETLRERWAQEAAPILTRAGLATLPEVRECLRAAEKLDSAAERLEQDAKHLSAEVDAAHRSAEAQAQRIAELLGRAGEASSFESRFANADTASLATRLTELGSAWKQQSEALVTEKERALSAARDHLAHATRDRDVGAFRATGAAERAGRALADAARHRAALGFTDLPAEPDPLLSVAVANHAELAALSLRKAAIAEQLETLVADDTSAVAVAEQVLAAAQAAKEATLDAQTQKIKALDEARSRRDTARGLTAALRAALEAADRVGAEVRVAAARTACAPYANDPAVPSDALKVAEALESEARAALDRVRRDLDQAEGALSRVGGDPLREELRREEEALDLAKGQQRDLELDSDSWKLLRETLEEANNEGTAHVGRSLAGPVSARLVELTGARYGNLRLDQHLKVEGVDVASLANTEGVLEALSVGTRNQIATLLRLTIAEQLKSAVILDDHLVHTDLERLAWFRRLLGETARNNTQVIVITCRAEDYLEPGAAVQDGGSADGAVRVVDFASVSKRFAPVATQGNDGQLSSGYKLPAPTA